MNQEAIRIQLSTRSHRRARRLPGGGLLCLLALICLVGLLVWTRHDASAMMMPSAAGGQFPIGIAGTDTPIASASTPAAAVSTPTAASASHQNASEALMRLYQGDPAQYATQQEYQTWWPSTCSATSITEVINAYRSIAGKPRYRITDILADEVQVGAISASQGLLDGFVGIRDTVAAFGFSARDLSGSTLDMLLAMANGGAPMIISFPPQTWNGGHLLVLLGGNGQSIRLADSSGYNMQTMMRDRFLGYWRGFAVVVTPITPKEG